MRPVRILATLALVASTAAAAMAVAGCKAADALSTQEVVVHFAPNTTRAQHAEVLEACGGLPHTSPQPIPTVEVKGQDLTDVRFLVNPGSGKNLNVVANCLAQERFHGVVLGYDLPGM
jgi:hypothetical protein